MNVLLIVIDALRADRLHLYGNRRPTSPYISRIAENALVCDSAYSQSPWTMPSMATLFTSTYESVHKLSMRPSKEAEFSVLDNGFVTMAECFQREGYKTAAISSQPWVSERTEFHLGFDDFTVVGSTSQVYEAEKITLKALTWLSNNSDRKFFLYLHFMTPHTPYDPPPPFSNLFWRVPQPEKFKSFLGKPNRDVWDFMVNVLARKDPERATSQDIVYLISPYDSEVSYVDWWIGVLHRALKRMRLLNDTLVVLMADHGESFFEHGMLVHDFHLYNEVLHVPMIFSNELFFPRQSRIDVPVGIIDVLPTILDLLQMSHFSQLQGRSILSHEPTGKVYSEKRIQLEGGLARVRHTLGLEKMTEFEKIQTIEWSLIYNHRSNTYEHYNLRDDPGEQVDVFEHRQEVATSMIRQMKDMRAENLAHQSKVEPTTTNLDEEAIDRLRSLGYLR